MNEREIFAEALDIADPQAREAYLDRVCAHDPELRRRVIELLALHARPDEFLSTPAVEQMTAKPTAILGIDTSEGSREFEQTRGYQEKTIQSDDDFSLNFLSPSDQPGSLGRLAHYEIQEVVGHGAFGIVLKAFDEKLCRVVAIKVLSPELAKSSPPRKRFLREARAFAAIRHENVVTVHAVEEQPIPYLVMEFIPGLTLERVMREHGPLDLPDIVRLGQQIAAGLAAAHARHLIHRDIKPSNILLENGLSGRVKITDFGLARAVDDASVTQSGVILGTPMYMSPEQAASGPIDARSDLFSLGSVLYLMTCGRPPFRAATTHAVLKRVAEETPRPIPEVIADVPDWLCKIIARLQAKKPEDRFATAQEVADVLASCREDLQAHRPVQLPDGKQETVPAVDLPGAGNPQNVLAAGPLAGESRTVFRRLWPMIAAASLVLLAGLGATEATGVTQITSTVVRLSTGSGTLVIETDDPSLNITIDGEDVSIHGVGVEQLTLKPGQYTLAATKNGEAVSRQLVTITRGGKQVVRVMLEGAPPVDRVVETLKPTEGWPHGAPQPAIAPFDAAQAARHQEEWAAYLKVPVEYTNSVGMKFRLIPPGEFLMGITQEYYDKTDVELARHDADTERFHTLLKSELPQHRVRLTRPIYMGVHEVTQQDYEAIMGVNPSYFSATGMFKEQVADLDTSRFPVDGMTWNNAAEFCVKLSAQEGRSPSYAAQGNLMMPAEGTGYRLPTEAEWEFSCRAGTTTEFWTGDSHAEAHTAGWFGGNSGGRSHPVGELKANPFGLYDVHGNVFEFTQDGWDFDTYRKDAATAPAIDPRGDSPAGYVRPFRGGNWRDGPYLGRSSARLAFGTHEASHLGFRVVLPVEAAQ